MKTNPDISVQTLRISAATYRTCRGAFCPLCEKPVRLFGFSEAADLIKTDAREIETLAGNGKLHRLHNIHGRVMICAESLFCLFQARPTQNLNIHALPGGAKV
ncbi:MAG TPA: hypothetical protein VIL74_25460 [Pyrinomonadaceae bacterium]|jgi:hypothetical protein